MKLQVLLVHLAALYLLDQIEASRTQVTVRGVEKKNNIGRYIS